MKETDDWGRPQEYPSPPNPDSGERIHEQWSPGYGAPPAYAREQGPRIGRRRKWVAGLLAFLVPGIGHMYLGLMIKGIVLMLLIAFDITAIVYVSQEGDNGLSVVLLSLLLPIIYFYNLFDALQSTDSVNERKAFPIHNAPEGWANRPVNPTIENSIKGMPPAGILFLAAAGIVVLVMADRSWTHWIFNSTGSMLGAIVLIGAGVGLWFWEMRGQHGGKR
ncbi:DUF6677 family protein [Cohnella silvisoli]|uniref:TM2 domain-containing protein n=1 Tax=Cohnella silvisoli TaxID=2873699 RepID=A0ABV1L355_9BACL|nr:DUF6677 family protein [Cohnella silvisoli]MCD9026082.1 hypothetical protein [Cohnella silvisoli]